MEIKRNSQIFCTLLILLMSRSKAITYEPSWDSLDTRPLPNWYDEAKFGIFICLGVYSVPAYESEWFWFNWEGKKSPSIEEFMQKNYRPNFTYADFAPDLNAEMFDPDAWTDVISASGAKYIVFTTKHHSGFTLWPSKYSWNWNSMDVGAKRDIVGELASSLRSKSDVKLGLYHSLFEWFHPLYLQDKAAHYKTQTFVERKTMPELHELVNTYKPDIIWSDGDWEAPYSYWNSTEFIAWLYNESPVSNHVVTNDRWGQGVSCHHGDFYTCSDRYNPGKLVNHKWENAMTIDAKSWGYRRDMQLKDVLSTHELISQLVSTVSCGGNLLMNINPTADGRITPIFEERLRNMGEWLKVNGDAIFASKPWIHQNDTITHNIWYTSKKSQNETEVFAILLEWPEPSETVTMGAFQNAAVKDVKMLGKDGSLKWGRDSKRGLTVDLSHLSFHELPCKWAWTLIINIQ